MINWRPRDVRNALFDAVDNQSPIVVYDLETTGFSATNDKIIQISGIKLIIRDQENFEELGRINFYVNPQCPIPPKITEITGINDEMVYKEKTIDELFPTIKDFFGDSPVVSGYNVAKFDNGFIKTLYERKGLTFEPITLDVIEMARDNIASKETENFKLGTIAHLYHVDTGLTFHNAMDDIIATRDLLLAFHRQYRESFEEDEKVEFSVENLKEVTSVSNLRYWAGYQGRSRIYIVTNLGEFYYDIRDHKWMPNSKNNPYSIEEINMDSLIKAVFKKTGVQDETEFVKAQTPKKTKTLVEINSINSLRYWEKQIDSSKTLHRIYITTDGGTFYYDIDKKKWVYNGENVNNEYDMEKLKALCFEKTGATSEEEFSKFR